MSQKRPRLTERVITIASTARRVQENRRVDQSVSIVPWDSKSQVYATPANLRLMVIENISWPTECCHPVRLLKGTGPDPTPRRGVLPEKVDEGSVRHLNRYWHELRFLGGGGAHVAAVHRAPPNQIPLSGRNDVGRSIDLFGQKPSARATPIAE